MILTCPNCSTRYLLNAHVLEPGGRRVMCSVCEEVWFEEPEGDEIFEEIEEPVFKADQEPVPLNEIESIPESVRPLPEGEDTPPEIPAEEKNLAPVITGWVAAAFVFLIIMSLLIMARDTTVKAWPPSALLFDTLGFETAVPGEDLFFEQINAGTQLDQKGHLVLDVDAKIRNRGDRPVIMQPVIATLRAAGGEERNSWFVASTGEAVQARDLLHFRTSYPDVSKEIKEVKLQFVLTDKTKEDKEEMQEEAKTASEDGENTQAHAPDDHAHQSAHEEHGESHPPASSHAH